MNNWFYMDRTTFKRLLVDELGVNLTRELFLHDFDTPVSFMIGRTTDEILTKIQQTFSRSICGKIICNDHCISCSQYPSSYAKLTWFVQRLRIMSPLTQPLIKQPSMINNENITKNDNSYEQTRQCLSDKNNTRKWIQNPNNLHSERECFIVIILILIVIIISLLVF